MNVPANVGPIENGEWLFLKMWDRMKATMFSTLSTLANLTLIILFSEMLKFSKIIASKSKIYIVKENSEYSRTFHLLKWMSQN
jgi:hypothetical protein